MQLWLKERLLCRVKMEKMCAETNQYKENARAQQCFFHWVGDKTSGESAAKEESQIDFDIPRTTLLAWFRNKLPSQVSVLLLQVKVRSSDILKEHGTEALPCCFTKKEPLRWFGYSIPCRSAPCSLEAEPQHAPGVTLLKCLWRRRWPEERRKDVRVA